MLRHLVLTLLILSFTPATACLRQLAVIKPFFTNPRSIHIIKNSINLIERKKLTYPDYDNRTGIMWSDFLVNTQRPQLIEECKNTIKLTRVNNILEKQNPESVFEHKAVKDILCQQILPKMLACITINGWAELPETAFGQFFLQRCNSSNAMEWHQDPGEDYNVAADFSLVIMLSEQNDPRYGWHGGEFNIRSEDPENPYHEQKVQTIIPKHNQAILFNNKLHSHAVTPIIGRNNEAQRDIIVVPLYLGKRPKPVV